MEDVDTGVLEEPRRKLRETKEVMGGGGAILLGVAVASFGRRCCLVWASLLPLLGVAGFFLYVVLLL